jgi:hypothetical protein
LGAVAGAAVFAGAAGAQRQLVLFPTPLTALPGPPPFPPPQATLPDVFRSPIRSSERIDVGLDERGGVVSVRATQRLVLARVGDYRLTVPAPAEDVEAAAGSRSAPGLRRGAILWQGFSGGGKVLAATATLELTAAERPLPLRVEISATVDGRRFERGRRSGDLDVSIRLRNVTGIAAPTFSADGDRVALARILDALRADPSGLTLGQGTYVNVTGEVSKRKLDVAVPFAVRGLVRFPTGRVRGAKPSFSTQLGGGKPLEQEVHVRGRAAGISPPRLELTVEPVVPREQLRPPVGESWAQAIRRDRRLSGRRLLDHAIEVSLTLARVRQYNAFLANPDPLGKAAARYVYRSAPRAAAAQPSPASGGGGLHPALIALAALGGVLALGGLAVLWAHS